MEPQQLASKVTQLEARVATLEDEGKIVRGEVKQVLTEIRTAVLARSNPFESESMLTRPVTLAPAAAAEITVRAAPAIEVPLPPPAHAERPPERAEAPPDPQPHAFDAPASREPIPLRPYQTPPPAPEQPQWSLLTIAGLAAWAEESMRRLGPLRLEILLDLCEAAGHLTREARTALSRVTELETAEPECAPSTNDTVVMLRQLDALVGDEQDYAPARMQARF